MKKEAQYVKKTLHTLISEKQCLVAWTTNTTNLCDIDVYVWSKIVMGYFLSCVCQPLHYAILATISKGVAEYHLL